MTFLASLTLLAASVQEEPSNRLVLDMAADGTVKVNGKVVLKLASTTGGDVRMLAKLFEAQRAAVKGSYPILIRADRSAPFHFIQMIRRTAPMHGGVPTGIRLGAVEDT